jgi:cyclophilin family peptidyl-prolyl cis-trans isomerase
MMSNLLTSSRATLISAALTAVVASSSLAQTAPAAKDIAEAQPKPSYGEVIKASPAGDWRPIAAERTLYLDLASGGRVVIELHPEIAPNHVANILALAKEGWYDGSAIVRSHDNYVAQWGDATESKPVKTAKRKLAGEFTTPVGERFEFTRLPDADGYAPEVGFSHGFATGRDPKAGTAWLAHCYGTLGVGRGNTTDSGDGTSLYVVTGHAPRHLDRNITTVGRVVHGIQHLSALPRGTGNLGFYEKPSERVPIKSIRIAADVPKAEQLSIKVLRTDSATFTRAVEALRNRGGDWFKVPAGYIELCNVQVAVRVE